MDLLLISIDYREPLWIAVAFIFGLAFKQMRLPPMLGFLTAGFILYILGAQKSQFLTSVADMGVTLLLFTIGLKLRVGTLARPEIWATASMHMGASVLAGTAILLLLGAGGMVLFSELDFFTALIIAFAVSFSSTVFAIKTLEGRGVMGSRYGQVAIGILVLQDIAAVVFLAISAGKMPSVWALALLALIPGRHVLGAILSESGHKELLAVYGFVLALGGAAMFEFVGMKGDLGALVLGIMLSGHPRANELSRNLMGFKDVFLVCFFLTIGLTGLPSWQTLGAATVLVLLLPVKVWLFYYLLTRFRLRARGAMLGAFVLGNYSEFGLIVAAVAYSVGWLGSEWITVVALALAISFVVSAQANAYADYIYAPFAQFLKKFESPNRLPGDDLIPLIGNDILVFGMGRVGRAAYDEMAPHVEQRILGIDLDEKQVENNVLAGRRVVLGDATHPEFWARMDEGHGEVKMVLLAMANHSANINAARHFRERGYTGPIVATALYPDQEDHLRENGINEVFNIYAEAGTGAASRMWELMDIPKPDSRPDSRPD